MLQKKNKKRTIEDYEGFNIPTEIYNFVEFFEVTDNIFIFSKENNCYEKYCIYSHNEPKFYVKLV
jgi:hypothetical protein